MLSCWNVCFVWFLSYPHQQRRRVMLLKCLLCLISFTRLSAKKVCHVAEMFNLPCFFHTPSAKKVGLTSWWMFDFTGWHQMASSTFNIYSLRQQWLGTVRGHGYHGMYKQPSGAVLQTDFKALVATWAPENLNLVAHIIMFGSPDGSDHLDGL